MSHGESVRVGSCGGSTEAILTLARCLWLATVAFYRLMSKLALCGGNTVDRLTQTGQLFLIKTIYNYVYSRLF